MSVGNKAVFASNGYTQPGLTYREWLIGQAAAGAANHTSEPDHDADSAISVADAIIATLDAEPSNA